AAGARASAGGRTRPHPRVRRAHHPQRRGGSRRPRRRAWPAFHPRRRGRPHARPAPARHRLRRPCMKQRLLTTAVRAALTATLPQGAPRDRNRPHIEPLMRLQPLGEASNEYELLIYGDIGDSWWSESVTAQSVAQQLNELDDTVVTTNVRINSYGGSVADGLAIYSALKRHRATKSVTGGGVAMSSASLIAMAGDTVKMPPTSILMIHAPWGGVYGNAKELRQYADVLDQFADAMANAYVAKSGMSRDDVLSLLKDGEDHYYTGEEAVAAGFADAVTTEETEEEEPDENARAFANQLLE